MNDLELYSTDELVHELNRRHDIALFVGANFQPETQDYSLTYYTWGGFYNVLGLVERIRRILNHPPIYEEP